MVKIGCLSLLLLLPQVALARVYLCVDHATGEKSFTDKACDTNSARAEVRVDPVNLDSGTLYKKPAKPKTWRSQMDTRKTGADYSAERRSLEESEASASTR